MTPETNAQSSTASSSDVNETSVTPVTGAQASNSPEGADSRTASDDAGDRSAEANLPEPSPDGHAQASASGGETASPGSSNGSSESAKTAPAEASASSGPAEPAPAEATTPAQDAATPGDAAKVAVSPATSEATTSDTAASSATDDAKDTSTTGDEVAATADGAPGEAKKKRRRRRRKKKKPTTVEADSKQRPATERAPFHVGEEVFGKVTAVLDHAIMVDLSGKALAIFDRGEMEPDDLIPEVGDRFLGRVHQDGSRGGLVVLTRKPLREEDAKAKIQQALSEGSVIHGLVTGVIKGGVDVDIDGLRAFAPASGMDLHPQNANFASLVGQRLDFKVSQYEKQGRDVVVTRRPMLENEAHERRKKALELLTEGQELKAVVRTVVEWGAFAAMPEAENLEGLIHASEASHDARPRLTELFKPGDELNVKITKIDERGKIWLSRKALLEDPWAEAREKYKPGNRLKAKITRLERFGAFVTLEHGIEGLIHVADLAFKRVEHPKDVVEEGQDIDVVVHHLDLRNRKVALHPALTGDQADEKPQQISRSSSVEVCVVKAESSGLQVRILGATGRAARGFIPAGQTGTERGTDLRQRFKAGTNLRAKVIDLDPRRGEPKLSIKQLAEDEERNAHREYRKKLAKEGGFGTLGDLLSAKLGDR